MSDLEFRPIAVVGSSSQHGRSTERVRCPFCGAVTNTYIWSRCGGGKRCGNKDCGAVLCRASAYRKRAADV